MYLPLSRGLMITAFGAIAFAAFLTVSAAQIAPSSDPRFAQQVNSEPRLYRALFSIVAHMERARLGNPPDQIGNMVAVEDSLRTKIDLSPSEWQSLVTTAVKVDAYTEQIDKQARDFARQGREESSKSLNRASSFNTLKAGLQAMQADRDSRVSGDIQKLEAALGTDGTAKLHTYLHSVLAASAHVTQLKPHSKVAP